MTNRFASCEGSIRPDSNRDVQRIERQDGQLVPDSPPLNVATRPKLRRGFAAMDREVVSEIIARKGGKAAHSAGSAHQFTSDEARVAGRKGGLTTHARRREAVRRQNEAQRESAGSARGKEGT
jgi:general stress protein YciG